MAIVLGCLATGAFLGGAVGFFVMLPWTAAGPGEPHHGHAAVYVALGAGMFGARVGAVLGAAVGFVVGARVFLRSLR